MSFTERLKDILSERKIKLTQLCRDTGISYNTMQGIIKRDTDIMSVSVQIPYKIAEYLDIDIYELIGKEAAEKIQKTKEKPDPQTGAELTPEQLEAMELIKKITDPKQQSRVIGYLESLNQDNA